MIMSVEIPYFATTSSFRLSNFSPSEAAEVDDGLLPPHWSLNACRAEVDMRTGSPAHTDSIPNYTGIDPYSVSQRMWQGFSESTWLASWTSPQTVQPSGSRRNISEIGCACVGRYDLLIKY